MTNKNITPETIAAAVKNVEKINAEKLAFYARKDAYDAQCKEKSVEPDWKMYYWPAVMDKDYEYYKKYGNPCIFLMGKSYRSMYHDDYASFTYWDNIEKKIIEDNWTTAAYCPSYDEYTWFPTFNDAWMAEMVDKDAYAEMRRKRSLKDGVDTREVNLHWMVTDRIPAPKYIPVVVEKGRKWKGAGLLLGFKHIPGFRGGVHVAEIYDALEHTIREVNYTYLTVDSGFINEWHKWSELKVSELTPDEWHYEGCNIDFNTYVKTLNLESPNLNGVVKIEENERNMKLLEKRRKYIEKKLPGIREWVAKNTDKTGYEAEKLAIHIFKKNNSWLYIDEAA